MADDCPPLAAVAPAYDALRELATDRLDSPIQTRVRTWEDGEFEVRVYHGYGPHAQRPSIAYHHVLRYHSADDAPVEGLLAVDVDSSEKTLIYRAPVDTDGVWPDAGRTPQEIARSAGGD